MLLPALQLLVEVVIPLGNLAELRVEAALEVDEVLPGLQGIARVLVALAHDLVEVPHRDLGHQRLLDRPAKHSLQAGVAAHLLAHVVHDGHDRVLVPPFGILNRLNLTPHDNDLTRGHQLAATVRRAQVLGHTRGCHIAVQSLGQSRHKLVPLASLEGSRGVRGEYKVPVQVDNQGIGGRREQRPALGRDTENIRAGLLDQVLSVPSMDNRDVQTAPLVDTNTEPDRFRGHGQHRRVVADKDNAAGRGDGGFNDAHDVGNRQAAEQRPHGEVLEPSGIGGELVAQRIVLHVDAHQVVEPRSREAEDPRHLFGVEQIGRLVPVDPHAAKVVAEQVVQRVARQERQAVRDPVLLLRVVVELGLRPLPQLADGLSALLVGARPNTQADAVEGVG